MPRLRYTLSLSSTSSSTGSLRRAFVAASPSTPCSSSSRSRAFRSAAVRARRSASVSASAAAFAVRNLRVSRRAILEAWSVDECDATRSSWREVCVASWRESFLSDDSASRTRRSRACWSVERDSVTRDTASLSGAMLKFSIVWWMSCRFVSYGLKRVRVKIGTYGCWFFGEQHLER